MATIRATCPTCGDVELSTSDVTLLGDDDGLWAAFEAAETHDRG